MPSGSSRGISCQAPFLTHRIEIEKGPVPRLTRSEPRTPPLSVKSDSLGHPLRLLNCAATTIGMMPRGSPKIWTRSPRTSCYAHNCLRVWLVQSSSGKWGRHLQFVQSFFKVSSPICSPIWYLMIVRSNDKSSPSLFEPIAKVRLVITGGLLLFSKKFSFFEIFSCIFCFSVLVYSRLIDRAIK